MYEALIEKAILAYETGSCDCGNVDAERLIRELAAKGFLTAPQTGE